MKRPDPVDPVDPQREPGLYERVLEAAGGALSAERPPRPSAAVVLWRERVRDGSGLETYWIRRGRSLPFMGGWHAFPGGAIERSDLAGAGESTRATGAPGLDLAPGVVACALRELEEEARVRLEPSRLVFAGRWLTPPFGSARFDNRFFLAEWRAGDGEPAVAPPENESGEWIAPREALRRIAAGEVLVAPPIHHLMRVLAEDGPRRGLPRLLDTAEADLGPIRRIEFRPGILMFPLAAATLPPASHTNAFLVGGGDAVLIDPGSRFEDENRKLLAALDAARARLGRRTVEIWLTHHHPDHVGGVETVRRALGVPVAAHPAAAERLAAAGIGVDRALADGERRRLAGAPELELRVRHTPGHARGHVAFEVMPGHDLIAGDLVAGFGTVVIDPPEGDMDEYLTSLASLRGGGHRTLFPAHGAPVLDVEAKLAEYVEHRLERERQILEAWRAGVREPRALVESVYADVAEAARPLAERQAIAHLDRLRAHGRLTP